MSGFGSGWGSPSRPGGLAAPDPGFGVPSTPPIFDLLGGVPGWGHPTGGIPTSVGAVVVTPVGRLPDDGGVVVRLQAHFWPETGPYTIHLLDADGQPWPAIGACWAVRMGGGYACMTDGTREILLFGAPPVPPGTYSIRLRYGAGVELVIPGALTVVNRGRNEAVYRMRRRLPGNYATGPRSVESEPEIAW